MLDPDYITANTSTRESSYAELTTDALFKMLNHFVKHLDLMDNGKVSDCSPEKEQYYCQQAKRLRDTIIEKVDDLESLPHYQRELLVNRRSLNKLSKKALELSKTKSQNIGNASVVIPETKVLEKTTVVIKRKQNSLSLQDVCDQVLKVIPASQENAKTFGFFMMNVESTNEAQLLEALNFLVDSGKIFKCKQKQAIIYFGCSEAIQAGQKCYKSEIVKLLDENRQYLRVSTIAFQLGLKECDALTFLNQLRQEGRIVGKFLNIAGKAERHFGI